MENSVENLHVDIKRLRHVLLTKREGQDSRILASFIFRVFIIDRDEVTVKIKTQNVTRPISRHIDSTSLVHKGFMFRPKREFFSCGTNAGNPGRARRTHLARSGSKLEYRFRFIFARGFSYIIM